MEKKLDEKLIENIIKDDINLETLEVYLGDENRSKNILVVEGKSDKEMIEKILQVYNLKRSFEMIEMKGVANFKKLYDALVHQENLNVKFLTDNDSSARRWIFKNGIDENDILTEEIYGRVKPSIKELEEYITNTAHYKHKPTKKKLIKRIWDWKNISIKNVKFLINTINASFQN